MEKNYQFTLTFKEDYAKAQADRILLNWLRPFRSAKHYQTDFMIISEIGSNLKYHFHGYFSFESDSDRCLAKYLLYKWKNRYGFIKLSYGTLSDWKCYISKDIMAPYSLIVTPKSLSKQLAKINQEVQEASASGDLLDYICASRELCKASARGKRVDSAESADIGVNNCPSDSTNIGNDLGCPSSSSGNPLEHEVSTRGMPVPD